MARLKLVISCWAGATLLFTAVLMVGDLGGGHKLLGYLLYANAVHFALWAILSPLPSWSAKTFPISGNKKGGNVAILLLIATVSAALVSVSNLAIVYSTYFPYRSAYPSFRGLWQAEMVRFFPFDVLIGILMVVAFSGWQAWRAFQEEHARVNELERRLSIARLEALRMQLHPHFLFNTLHTIAGLIAEDPPTARRMVIALGDLLRITLKDTGDRMRTLAEELEFSDLYLGIEKLRLGDRLVLNYEIEPSAGRALVPQLLLQPLFENAIRHGASQMTEPCEIRFCATYKPNTLDIVIQNDGPVHDPSSTQAPSKLGVGLTNTIDRLRIHFGDRHRFQYSNRPQGGVRVEISIPYKGGDDGIGADCSLAEPMTISDSSDWNNGWSFPRPT